MTAAYTPRDLAEQTLDGTLPYEETWREMAENVVALVEAAEAFIEIAEPAGNEYVVGKRFLFWQARDRLKKAVGL